VRAGQSVPHRHLQRVAGGEVDEQQPRLRVDLQVACIRMASSGHGVIFVTAPQISTLAA